MDDIVESGSPAGEVGSGADTPEAAEREAKLFGWNPEYEGPGKKSAEEFLEEGKRINGFLRKDLDKLRSEISKRDATVAELRGTMAEFAAFHQETEKKAYDRAVKELREERKEALRDGDGAKVVEIEDRIDELNEAAPKPREAVQRPKSDPQQDPVWTGWVSENRWFQESPKLRAITNAFGDLVRSEHPDLVGRPFLEEVKRRVAEEYPQELGNRERARTGAVGGSGESRGNGSGNGYGALPAEAKVACDKFVKQGLVASREAYAKDYFGE
jgi:hypothetical protein